ncbi:iron-containing redox enzyme family protein [Paenibacillus chungangensis]|uniref:Iron-containing redox enzyme family protein n=1 Tax=Paenibacillus chungangensis TaxID=696535 RepID=A0ABW3HNB0_9BACL
MTTAVYVEQINEIIEGQLKHLKETNPFFVKFPQKVQPSDLTWCSHLYHLSHHFAELLKVRWDRFQDAPHDVFSTHYQEEKDHPEMLREFMLGLGLKDPVHSRPSYETENFISALYRAAAVMEDNLSLLIINSTAEKFAHMMYVHVLERLQNSGMSNLTYWEVHTVADEEHSDVYHYLSNMNEQQVEEAKHLIKYTVYAIDQMQRSWFAE